jgi:pyridoxal phosphate enzyme (YggS family)
MEAAGATQQDIAERLEAVRSEIAAAAARVERTADEVRLIAVSKTHPPETLRAAIAAGATDFGENRVQEAEGKIMELGRRAARWHLIGHLQGNKARRAVELFDVIHSLDSVALALRLERICDETGREELPVLLQVDLGGEATKSGVAEADLSALVETVTVCKRLRLLGLMTLPPFFEDAERARPYFRRLRELRDERLAGAGELSMGMSHDFVVAIEEGATMVRVGTAIFGARDGL